MATPEDDISILSRANDTTEDLVDEADILSEHFAINSITPPSTASLQVFRNAYDDLKHQYNNLYSKCELLTKKNKEYESRLNAQSTDIQTGSFLMVNDPTEQSNLELGTLRGRVKELERKLMLSEVTVKSLKADKSNLECTLDSLRNIDSNRNSVEREKVNLLEAKVKRLQDRLMIYESKFDKDGDVAKQISDLSDESKKINAENLLLLQDVRKLTEENAALKRKLYAHNPNPVILSNGNCMTSLTNNFTVTGTSKGVIDQSPDFSLSSSLPAVDELEQLKIVIKKLKTVVQTQNAYLLKLDGNPAVRKLLREEKLGLSLNGAVSGVSSISGSSSKLNNGTIQRKETSDSSRDKLSPVSNCPEVLTNQTWSYSSNRQFSPERLQVALPGTTEQYDNVPDSPQKNLRQYQSKSQSEVISRPSLLHKDLQRSHSHTISGTKTSWTSNERVGISPVTREAFEFDGLDTAVDPISICARNNLSPQRESERIPSIKTCPVCNADFTSNTVTEFQTHVFNCVDSVEQPNTLTCESDPERICPVCNHLFPAACPQQEVENHVNAHFGEAPTDAFEILNP